MNEFIKAFIKFFTSLKLTVVLLALSIILIFWATLAQVTMGIWGVQENFFRTFIVLKEVNGFPIPVFPGGYFIGGLLFLNLVAARLYRFKFAWRKVGLELTHAGLLMLLVGELFTSLWQEDSQMRIARGETVSYAESFRGNELVLIDTTDPKSDLVVSIPESRLHDTDESLQDATLPFRVIPRLYVPNAFLQPKEQAPSSPVPQLATQDYGSRFVVLPMKPTTQDDRRNQPAAYIELVGPEGSLGVWLVSPMLIQPQSFDYAGRTWKISLRFKRDYHPFSLTLKDLRHDLYPGSNIPKNFSSLVHLKSDDGHEDRDALIFMNNPLRYGGLTFYQYQMDEANGFTVLQVVRNPSWVLPYVACLAMSFGLLIHFIIHLVGFVQKRSRKAAQS